MSPWTMSPSLHTKDNHSKELKYNQTQPNSTEPMKMSGLENSKANQELRSDQLLDGPFLDTCLQRSSAQMTFDVEVKGSGGPGAAGNEIQAPRSVGWRRRVSQSCHQIVLQLHVMFSITRSKQPHTHLWSILSPPHPTLHISVFGIDFLIEKVLCQQVELPILFSDSMCPDKLELLQCKLVELVLHLPDG